MSMIPSQAPGNNPEAIVPLEETETGGQVHGFESVHSLTDNEENMTVDDSQEDDTATVPGPDVEVGDNVSHGDEPEDSQQTLQLQQSRLPPPVLNYNAYCRPNMAIHEGWYQLPVPSIMGQFFFSLQQVLLCLEQMNYHLNSLYTIQGQPKNFCCNEL